MDAGLTETELGEEIESDFSEDTLTARMDVERLLDGLSPKQQELIRQVKLEATSSPTLQAAPVSLNQP